MQNKGYFTPADILLPKEGFEQFAVIACDQHTSEPAYWQETEKIVGDTPSALRLILPEAWLGEDDAARIEKINQTMEQYTKDGVFSELKDTFVYVERTQQDGTVRHGIVGKIDLNAYDYHKGTDAAVRATEETVLERIPPRVAIREGASLELPHVMLLIDDPDFTVIEPLTAGKEEMQTLYDFDLMQKGGHITGRKVSEGMAERVMTALEELEEKGNGLVFCVGDGNHSLASAKESYLKTGKPLAQYALVEVVNIHDEALQFEPIYRVLFGVDAKALLEEFVTTCGEDNGASAQRFEVIIGEETQTVSVRATSKLAVGTLQTFLDDYLKRHSEAKIDYIHGEDTVKELCKQENTIGFLFEGMTKEELFPAVDGDGSLPRKTFSMGHADDKRFYLEARYLG